MADLRANNVFTSIISQVNDLSSAPSEQCLFRVPYHLRRVQKESYEPNTIAIGPYHHDKSHLQAMKEHKLRYFQLLLQRTDKERMMRCVEALIRKEDTARRCYAEHISLAKDKFVEMMLLDGCFVIELIRRGPADDDPLVKLSIMLYSLTHDMLLLENQLPFFVLKELFGLIMTPNQESDFIKLILRFFVDLFPVSGDEREVQHAFPDIQHLQNSQHLLGLMHDYWLPSPNVRETYTNTGEQDTQSSRCLILWPSNCRRKRGSKEDYGTHSSIRCAVQLKEAGIKFKRAKGCRVFDIRFENGTLLIPQLTIQDGTDSLLRNLIAYEQFLKESNAPYHVTDYTKFMDCLINTEKDVELLCRHGIIDNLLGDDEVVATLFNKLLDNVTLYYDNSYYADTYEKVNTHCSRRWNLWKEKLKQDYFNSPWALISFLAAFLLLLLTAVQTVYGVLSYYK